MSLLDKANEDVIVYPEEVVTDSDGNIMTRPSVVGIPAKATIQIAAASGTSARRSEQDNEGFETEIGYRIRFPRSFTLVLGAQSQIEWRGKRYAVIGDVHEFRGSSITAHSDYMMRRS